MKQRLQSTTKLSVWLDWLEPKDSDFQSFKLLLDSKFVAEEVGLSRISCSNACSAFIHELFSNWDKDVVICSKWKFRVQAAYTVQFMLIFAYNNNIK